jgi:hypothetical protein
MFFILCILLCKYDTRNNINFEQTLEEITL